jgi:hypothetical protein
MSAHEKIKDLETRITNLLISRNSDAKIIWQLKAKISDAESKIDAIERRILEIKVSEIDKQKHIESSVDFIEKNTGSLFKGE